MSRVYNVQQIAKALRMGATTVRVHRADPTCPLHGEGMRRQNGGRWLVATPEVLAAYRAWLAEPVPASKVTGAA
jgi:hypothetical protein